MENRRLRQKVTGAEVISPVSDSESRDHWVTRARRLAQAWLIQPGCAGCDAARRVKAEAFAYHTPCEKRRPVTRGVAASAARTVRRL